MRPERSSPVPWNLVAKRYAVAIGCSLLALVLTYSLGPRVEGSVLIWFTGAVAVAGWYGGLWPGLASAALSAVSIATRVLPAWGTPDTNISNTLQLGAFLVVAWLVSWLCEALRRANERTRQQARVLKEQADLLHLANDGILVRDLDDRVVFWSHGAKVMYGWETSEVLGRQVYDLLGTHFPEPPEAVRDTLRRFGRWEGELEQTRRDGSRLTVSSRWVVRRDRQGRPVGVLEIDRDLTDRLRVEEALRDSEERYRAIAETASDAIVTVDDQDRIQFLNVATEQIFGYARQELEGEALARLMPDHTRRLQEQLMGRYAARLPSAGQERVELPGRHKSGRSIPLEASFGEFERNRRRYVTVIIRDITDRKAIERRLMMQYEVTRVLAEAPSLGEACPRILEAVCESLDWEVGAWWVPTDGADRLACLGTWRRPSLLPSAFEEDTRTRLLGPGEGLPGSVWSSGVPGWWPDASREERFLRRASASADGLRAALAFPILRDGAVVAVIEFLSPEQRQPDRFLLESFTSLSSQIAQFVGRREAEEMVRSSLHEKEVLLKEIHHRVKNNMQMISSLLSLQADTIREPALEAVFEESQNRIRAMALIHEALYQSRDLSRIPIGEYVRLLIDYLARSYRTPGQDVRVEAAIEPPTLSMDTAIPCGLMLNELISNALKHAFPDGRSGRVRVALRKDAAGMYELTVADDGIGMDPRLTGGPATSLGLRLVAALVEQLNGSLDVSCEAGTAFTVRFPERHVVRPEGTKFAAAV